MTHRNLKFQQSMPPGSQAMSVGCYRTRCTPRADAPEYQAFEADEGYALEIQDPVGAWHTCSPSKNISVPGFVGVLTCPAAWGSFCAPPSYDSIRGMRTIPERLMEAKSKYGDCREERTWADLTTLQMDLTNPMKPRSGGLGKLMIKDKFEVWLCCFDNACSRPNDPFCYVFDEEAFIFAPWGYNSELEILDLSAMQR